MGLEHELGVFLVRSISSTSQQETFINCHSRHRALSRSTGLYLRNLMPTTQHFGCFAELGPTEFLWMQYSITFQSSWTWVGTKCVHRRLAVAFFGYHRELHRVKVGPPEVWPCRCEKLRNSWLYALFRCHQKCMWPGRPGAIWMPAVGPKCRHDRWKTVMQAQIAALRYLMDWQCLFCSASSAPRASIKCERDVDQVCWLLNHWDKPGKLYVVSSSLWARGQRGKFWRARPDIPWLALTFHSISLT